MRRASGAGVDQDMIAHERIQGGGFLAHGTGALAFHDASGRRAQGARGPRPAQMTIPKRIGHVFPAPRRGHVDGGRRERARRLPWFRFIGRRRQAAADPAVNPERAFAAILILTLIARRKCPQARGHVRVRRRLPPVARAHDEVQCARRDENVLAKGVRLIRGRKEPRR